MIRYLVVFIISIPLHLVFAQSLEVPTIVIEADKIKSKLNKTTSNIKILTKEDLSNYQSLDDVLKNETDIDVVHSGPKGSNASLFLRGTDSSHTLILIDGIIMNDPSNPNRQYDIGRLNLANVEKIEILKGSQGLLYGSNAIGGVILITTQNKNSKSLYFYNGSYGLINPGFVLANNYKDTHYMISLDHVKNTGFSAVNDPTHPNDKDGTEILSFHSKINQKITNNLDLEVLYRKQKDSTDIDKMGLTDDPNDYQKNAEEYFKGQINWNHSFFASHLAFKESNHKRDLYVLPDQYDSQDYRYKTIGKNQSLSLENEFYINDHYSQKLDVDFSQETMSVDNSKKYKNKNISALFFNRIEISEDLLDFGIRLDHNDLFNNNFTYRFSYLKSFNLINVKFNHSTGFKASSLNQLFDPTYGNKDLKPEKSTTTDVGFEMNIESSQKINLSFYTTKIKERHSYNPLTYVNINDGLAEINGAEVNYKYFINSIFTFSSSYNYLNAIDVLRDKTLIRRPRNSYHLELNAKKNQHDLILNTHFTGKRKDINELRIRVNNPSYQTWNMIYNYQVKENLKARLKLNNLFNTKYEEVVGYNSIGRSYEVGFNYNF